MPAVAPRTLTLTPDEYVEWEAEQLERHEYHFGEVYPMPGGTAAHAQLISALNAFLFVALRGTGYVVLSGAMRVQATPDQFVYPDLSVTRGPGTFRSDRKTSLLDPVLVAEVLSPTTRVYDRGEKLDLYRSMPSVEEVLFVDSEKRWVEIGRRTDDGWAFVGPLDKGTIALSSVGADLDVDDLYHGVEDLG
ncbi:MAG: Uma2 family endonuclease [Bacteroidota bacterium]